MEFLRARERGGGILPVDHLVDEKLDVKFLFHSIVRPDVTYECHILFVCVCDRFGSFI